MGKFDILTPKFIGPEITEVDTSEPSFTAFKGTGFNPDNEWHLGLPPICTTRDRLGPDGNDIPIGGDGLRYAIAIQQFRDRKQYDQADMACKLVISLGYVIGKAHDRTVVSGIRSGSW